MFDSVVIIFNISIARFYICIWSSAHYNYSRNWREADRGRLRAYRWRFKQPLLVHTSLMISPPPQIYVSIHPVNFPCGRKPEYPEKTHDFRQSVDFYSFHMRTGFESHWDVLTEAWTCGLRGERQVRWPLHHRSPVWDSAISPLYTTGGLFKTRLVILVKI
jgi:hypothetical protein